MAGESQASPPNQTRSNARCVTKLEENSGQALDVRLWPHMVSGKDDPFRSLTNIQSRRWEAVRYFSG